MERFLRRSETMPGFDVSHMGEFIVKGTYALDLIQRITTNDVAKLESQRTAVACLTKKEASWTTCWCAVLRKTKCICWVVNAGNIDKDWNWINQHNTEGASMENISERTGLLAISGPGQQKYFSH